MMQSASIIKCSQEEKEENRKCLQKLYYTFITVFSYKKTILLSYMSYTESHI